MSSEHNLHHLMHEEQYFIAGETKESVMSFICNFTHMNTSEVVLESFFECQIKLQRMCLCRVKMALDQRKIDEAPF